MDDSPEACSHFGVPPLPSLSPWPLPLKPAIMTPFLFLSEFLSTFRTSLGMKNQMTAAQLYDLLVNGGNMTDVYKKLLKVSLLAVDLENWECQGKI